MKELSPAASTGVEEFIARARAEHGVGHLSKAIDWLEQAAAIDPSRSLIWRKLGDLSVYVGQFSRSRAAYAKASEIDRRSPILHEGLAYLSSGKPTEAVLRFNQVLAEEPSNLVAVCSIARGLQAQGAFAKAESILRRALAISAHLPLTWAGLSRLYEELGRVEEAETAIRHALTVDDNSSVYWIALGNILAKLLRYDEALDAYNRALVITPNDARSHLVRGHMLKVMGRRAECEAAYRHCLSIQPGYGPAYFALSNLKTYQFSQDELKEMLAYCQQTKVPENGPPSSRRERAQRLFAMAKGYEQRDATQEAFTYYLAGNGLCAIESPFDLEAFRRKCARQRLTFTRRFFSERVGWGCRNPAPIFVVGLPRSGSTLIEQILGSHSLVEGTAELSVLSQIVRNMDISAGKRSLYPECVASSHAESVRKVGEAYIQRTRAYRRGRPFFTDKMPGNFLHSGLIHLILPEAKIVDIRRHPMDACWSAFRQYFAKGQSFTSNLDTLAGYYIAYLELMDHWDAVLPQRILQVSYEDLVRNTESVIKRLLDYCGLPFEPECLRFHENRRSVNTASAEQVRLPMYNSSIGYWRRFETELEPLLRKLEPILGRFDYLHA